ncbi:tRNA 2-thiocytidine biosynthesis TtcA family protein [Xylanibacter oryzae]|uniref:tRNA 2-thiocytidine biosynthesis TtcA family protein n=1 Tax=Xylanibacter oryzae TaxID=185293 RepID=UPI0004AE45BE|nr:tRNA 2-thiocytidine biosynthesis TtcA family protein [Xylanibacter oryzae]
MPTKTVKQKLEQKIISRFRKALSEYRLIDDGDHILIGLSGGKDSLCLLELLARRMKIQKPTFKVEAVHIRMKNIKYETDTEYLKSFASQYDVPLHIITTEFDASTDNRKSPCFLCSWNRRKNIFNLAQELGCNKIAFGHHFDDIIHTTLMNEIFQGHFSTMPVKLKFKKMPLTLIRPLCLEIESDIKQYAINQGYQKQIKLCPYETDSHRSEIKQLFDQIEKMNPEARYSIWNSLESEGKLIEGL